jgi:hypothetical protein
MLYSSRKMINPPKSSFQEDERYIPVDEMLA